MATLKHNLFISWSGNASHRAALVLRDWLPKVLHDIDAFVSSEDIEKGEPWDKVLGEALEEIRVAIICVTPTN